MENYPLSGALIFFFLLKKQILLLKVSFYLEGFDIQESKQEVLN